MATLKQISQETGFSVSTTSIVLRGEGEMRSISKDTIDTIFEAARRLGYSPNLTARRLRSNDDTKSVAVFWTSDFRASLVFRLLQGMQDYIEESGQNYDISIRPYHPDKLCSAATSKILSSYSASIVCTASEKDIRYLDTINDPSPIVLYNRYSDHIHSVCVDNGSIGRTAAKALIEKGAENIVILTSKNKFQYIDARIAGFNDHLRSVGRTAKLIEAESLSIESAYEAIMKEDIPAGMGMFCISEALVFGAMQFFREHGMYDEISRRTVFVGTGDPQLYHAFLQNCSVIDIPIEKMGYECLAVIAKNLVNNKAQKTTSKWLDFSLYDIGKM